MPADTAEKSKSMARYRPNGVASTNPQRLHQGRDSLGRQGGCKFFPDDGINRLAQHGAQKRTMPEPDTGFVRGCRLLQAQLKILPKKQTRSTAQVTDRPILAPRYVHPVQQPARERYWPRNVAVTITLAAAAQFMRTPVIMKT